VQTPKSSVGPAWPGSTILWEDEHMKWTKPEAEIVAVTMEVTAYVATL
jgi:coenzyme PQQ precursor peptide PqqA